MTRILVVEDEQHLARFIDRGLRKAGYETVLAEDGLTALEHVSSGVDLVVLDVGLPRMDGFTVLKLLRGLDPDVPVIMCTARDSAKDKVAGLEGGADDYLAKPYTFAELLARIRLRLRPRSTTPEPVDSALTRGDLVLDPVRREVTVGGRAVTLSAREFTLLRTLMEHAGQVLSRDQLRDWVWDGTEGGSNVVDVYVGYLRGKVGAERIVTVRGVGYRLD